MTLIEFLVVLVVGGLVWWLLERYVPLPEPVKIVLRVVLVLVLVLMLLAFFGVIALPFKIS